MIFDTPFLLTSILLACAATILAWTFVWIYHREPWRSTVAGQHLMHFTLGVAVISTWSIAGLVLRLIFGLPPWLELALAVGRVLIFGWLCWMLWKRLSLLRATIRARKLPSGATPFNRKEPS
jgi:hypothetical protein